MLQFVRQDISESSIHLGFVPLTFLLVHRSQAFRSWDHTGFSTFLRDGLRTRPGVEGLLRGERGQGQGESTDKICCDHRKNHIPRQGGQGERISRCETCENNTQSRHILGAGGGSMGDHAQRGGRHPPQSVEQKPSKRFLFHVPQHGAVLHTLRRDFTGSPIALVLNSVSGGCAQQW